MHLINEGGEEKVEELGVQKEGVRRATVRAQGTVDDTQNGSSGKVSL